MADEKVKYVYELVDKVSNNLKKINAALDRNENEFKKAGESAKKFGNTTDKVGKNLTGTIVKFGGVAAAAISVKKAMDFTVKSVFSFSGASAKLRAIIQPTTKQFENLEKAALKYGSTTAFTASQVMSAYTEQAKLGQTVNEILSSGSAVLDLAAMSQIGLSEAATISTQTLNQFNLDASQTNRVVDVMAKSFTRSALDAFKFGESMKYVGTVGAESGNSIEDVTAALGALSDRAIESSQAGTATRRVMLELADSNSKASKAIAATGKKADTFIKKLKVLKSLNLTLTDTTEMFGLLSSTAATVLVNAADDVKKLSEELEKADGTAKDMAETMLDSLPGAVTKMKSSLEGLALTLKDTLEPKIKSVLNEITKLAQQWKFLIGHKDEEKRLNVLIDEVKELKLLRKEHEIIRDTQLSLQSQKGTLFDPEVLKQARNNIRTINEEIIALNKSTQGDDSVPSGTKKTGDNKTSLPQNAVATFKAPKVPVSYFEEMVVKYQEQAEYHHIYTQMQIDKEADLQELRKTWMDEMSEKHKNHLAQKKQEEDSYRQAWISSSISGAQSISNAMFAIGRQRTAHEKKQQVERIKNSNRSEKEKAKMIEALERQEFEKNKRRSIMQAILNGALGITKTIATVGMPAALPLLFVQAAITAANIAVIASQKFAKGGIVQKEPGKSVTGDQHLIRANPGEMMLTKEQQRGLGSTVNIGDTNINVYGDVTEDTLEQIDQTLEDRNESLRTQLITLSESGRIAGVIF